MKNKSFSWKLNKSFKELKRYHDLCIDHELQLYKCTRLIIHEKCQIADNREIYKLQNIKLFDCW